MHNFTNMRKVFAFVHENGDPVGEYTDFTLKHKNKSDVFARGKGFLSLLSFSKKKKRSCLRKFVKTIQLT